MITIKRFTFNNFMVNTYVLSDTSKHAVVIDAACYEPEEQMELAMYIESRGLIIDRHLNTHCHIDHVLGSSFIFSRYKVLPEYHQDSLPLVETTLEMAQSFGFRVDRIIYGTRHLNDNEIIDWGNSDLKVLFTPGHAAGSVCFLNETDGFVVTGDVLFKDTIGRTDLPSGDFNLLMNSIKTKLFTLAPGTIVYPGHGPETTIGYEMENNPFIR